MVTISPEAVNAPVFVPKFAIAAAAASAASRNISSPPPSSAETFSSTTSYVVRVCCPFASISHFPGRLSHLSQNIVMSMTKMDTINSTSQSIKSRSRSMVTTPNMRTTNTRWIRRALGLKGWNLWVSFMDIRGRVRAHPFGVRRQAQTIMTPTKWTIVLRAIHNTTSLEHPTIMPPRSSCVNLCVRSSLHIAAIVFFDLCHSSTIFYTRLLSHQNLSGILKALTLSPLLLISVRLSKSAVKPVEVSPTPILGCQRSYRGITRSFHLNLPALQIERSLEIGTPRCTERSGQQMGSRMYFEGSRVSLFLPPPILSKIGLDANCGHILVIFTDYRMTNQAAFAPIEIWSRIHHPSIVPVREAFTTLSFNDNCMS